MTVSIAALCTPSGVPSPQTKRQTKEDGRLVIIDAVVRLYL
jgi:hypothetical protein